MECGIARIARTHLDVAETAQLARARLTIDLEVIDPVVRVANGSRGPADIVADVEADAGSHPAEVDVARSAVGKAEDDGGDVIGRILDAPSLVAFGAESEGAGG